MLIKYQSSSREGESEDDEGDNYCFRFIVTRNVSSAVRSGDVIEIQAATEELMLKDRPVSVWRPNGAGHSGLCW